MKSRYTRLGLAARGLGLLVLATCVEDVPTASSPQFSQPLSVPFSAATASPSAMVLLGAGDIARCDRTNDQATAQLLNGYPSAAVFTLGDNINGNGSLTDFNNCYGPSWGQAKARTRPSVGEKDYKTAGAGGFFDYFGAAAVGDSAKYYYSYDLGAWHIMVLNDNISMVAGSPQEQWLRADLAANTKQCTLAYWHHPLFSSTGTNNLASVKPLWNALYAYNADVVLNAHYNNYERFAPQNPSEAADPKGIREFIVGTGGQDLQNPGGAKPNSQVRNGTTYGVLMLTLDTLSYSWQFLPVAGKTFTDTGSTACHTRVPVASVTVSPASATVQVASTVQLTATPLDANGVALTGRTITWTSSDTSVALVSTSGLVTGKKAGGPVTITATSEGKSGTAAISVGTVPVASVTVAPTAATISAFGGVQLSATANDSNGNSIAGAAITWTSSAPGVANVTARGYVTGLSAGSASIAASSGGKSATSAITVQAYSGPAPVLAGAGDIADCSRSSQEGTARVLDGIIGHVATFGDGAYPNGALSDYMNCFDPSWGRHKARTRPATGNHEYNFGMAAGAPGYYAYWGAAAGDSAIGYYSYDLGAWHIVVINSSLDMSTGSAQEQWLRADLAAHPTTCTLAYWHHPRFSSGGNGSTVETQPIWQALYDNYADVVLNGHDHDYERFAPQTPTGVLDTARGIREFVVGTGGNSLYSWPGAPIANSEIRDNTSYGVIKMTLWPTSYDWEFIPVNGATFTDKGSALCKSSTPLANQAPVANPGGPYNSEGSVTLDGTQSRDPDNNNPLTYAWDLGDGTTATTATVPHTYAPGTYTVTLTVTDAKGASSSPVSTTVTVGNLPPTVNAGPDQSVVAGTPLSLQASFNDPGSTDYPWSYTIAWGDGASDAGTTSTQSNPIAGSHVYASAGHYNVQVTVTDKFGAAGSAGFLVKSLDPSTVTVFSGASNIASCGTDEDEATAEIIDNLPGSVFVLGDNVNPSGSLTNYQNCYDPTWGRAKARTHPTIGNHEYDVTGANGYWSYFGRAAGDSGTFYYSFDLGPYWHVIVLNNTASVNSGAGSVEEQWLKADLAASTKQCTIAMFHYPLFFSSDDPSWHSASGVLPIWNDLYAAGAEIVLNGQQYDYERFAPQDPGANLDPRGIREFNVGGGGYATAMPSSIAPNTEAVSDAFGVLKLTLGPDSYIWEYIPAPGYTFTDKGSGNCH